MAKSKKQKSGQVTREGYSAALPEHEALREEAAFILSDAIKSKGIKIHSVESRVKSYESFRRKWESRDYENPDEIHDLVGVRAICLFKSDLMQIDDLIKKAFLVLSVDDKVNATDDTFGYMSVHYLCKMHDHYRGPRYDKVKDRLFEVQVRTLCMHAWAAISHYLDYKADWDIPDNLKKGLNALSGLFFVADEQYEALYNARHASLQEASRGDGRKGITPINLDTMQAFLVRELPGRKRGESALISVLIGDLVTAGYETVEAVEEDFKKATAALKAHEERVIRNQDPDNTSGIFFMDVGAVRVALREANPEFAAAVKKRTSL